MPISTPEISRQMVAQLRLLNPNYSAEVGTPERLILDTVAQGLNNSQIDLIGLENAMNIETKFGTNLDNFVALFKFARKEAAFARGYVEFTRNDRSELPVFVPQGTIVQSTESNATDNTVNQFATTVSVSLPPKELSTSAVPIEALTSGEGGNVESGKITILVGELPVGITGVTNPIPTTGGKSQESDNELKVRFKNTVLRNLAGTKDQYMALALASFDTTKANVLGPVSEYQEYIQVPSHEDIASYVSGEFFFSGNSTNFMNFGSVNEMGEVIHFEQLARPADFSNLGSGKSTFNMLLYPLANPTIYYQGVFKKTTEQTITREEKLYEYISGKKEGEVTDLPEGLYFCTEAEKFLAKEGEWSTALSSIPYAKSILSARPVMIISNFEEANNYFFREGTDFNFNAMGKLQGDALREIIEGNGVDPRVHLKPSVTFTNIYKGTNESVLALKPEEIALLEYSYTSEASRNDFSRNVTNAIDVYINGESLQEASVNILLNFSAEQQINAALNSPYYFGNYRRDGEPTVTPELGNFFTPILNQPVLSLPKEIKIENTVTQVENIFYLGTHYWLIHDVTELANSTRARDAIEWNGSLIGSASQGSEFGEISYWHQPAGGEIALSLARKWKKGGGAKEEETGKSTLGNVRASLSWVVQRNSTVSVEGNKPEPVTLPPVAGDPSLEWVPKYIGSSIKTLSEETERPVFEIEKYTYNKTIAELQIALEGSKQTTTDVLAHGARKRYFKLDLTVVYESTHSKEAVDAAIQEALTNYFEGQPFGTVINFSDLIQRIHGVEGVENVRWTADINNAASRARVIETDVNGRPLVGAYVTTQVWYSNKEGSQIQTIFVAGEPRTGNTILSYKERGGSEVKEVTLNTRKWYEAHTPIKRAAYIKEILVAAGLEIQSVGRGSSGGSIVYFTPNYEYTVPAIDNSKITEGEYLYDFDFFLSDDQVPSLPIGKQTGDTLPGLILRTRAQNTWERR